MERSSAADLAARMRSLLQEKGKSQAGLARYCKVSTAAVSKWFRLGVISPYNIMLSARFFGVSEKWLATGEGEKEPVQVRAYLPEEEDAPDDVEQHRPQHRGLFCYPKLTAVMKT